MLKVLVFNDTRVDSHHGCYRVMENIELSVMNAGYELVGTVPAHKDWRNDESVLKKIKNSDVLIVNGEGTLHDSRQAGAYLLEVAVVAKRYKKQSVLINATWENNSSTYINLLKNFRYISVRDRESQKELKAYNIDSVYAPDMSILVRHEKISNTRERIGFVDSVIPLRAKEIYELSKKTKNSILAPIIFPKNGVMGELSFIKACYYSYGISDKKDVFGMLCYWINNRASSVISSEKYVDKISKLKLLVTGRYHAVCIALITETPFIAIESNTSKISRLIDDIGLNKERVVNSLIEMSQSDMEKFSVWSLDESIKLKYFLESGRRSIELNFKEIGLNDKKLTKCYI